MSGLFNKEEYANGLRVNNAVFDEIGAEQTVTTLTGVIEGGRTGLTAIFTGLFFIIAMFLSPIAELVPSCATASALIFVGVLMMSSVKNIDWASVENSVPAF